MATSAALDAEFSNPTCNITGIASFIRDLGSDLLDLIVDTFSEDVAVNNLDFTKLLTATSSLNVSTIKSRESLSKSLMNKAIPVMSHVGFENSTSSAALVAIKLTPPPTSFCWVYCVTAPWSNAKFYLNAAGPHQNTVPVCSKLN
ncbi:hypothetical protein ACOSQ3_003877 [Xanthoceras sorbifolium]